MPLYEYDCPGCGPFDALGKVATSAEPRDCPRCGTASPRVILTMPAVLAMDAGRRRAHATNERSAHAPEVSTADSRAHKHGPGCACCGGSKGKSRAVTAPDGSKAFPADRPWMISH
jgi:putative FmdB family regulatory protein